MPGLALYYDLMSQPSRAVYIFLRFNNIPFQEKPMALRKGEHMTPEYAKINPFQKVPVIDDNGFILTESVAILKYLCDKYPHAVTPNWYPADIESRAKVDEYLAWQHTNTRIYGSMYFRTKVLEPRMMNKPVDTQKLRRFKTQLDTTLDFIENVFLHNRDYFAGDDLTLADLLGICELTQPSAAGLDVTQGRPRLAAWMERVGSRLEPHFTEAHEFVWRLRDKDGEGTTAKM